MDPFKDVMYRAFNSELEKIALGTAGKLTAGAVIGVGALEGGKRVMRMKRLADAEAEDIRINNLQENMQRAQMEIEMRQRLRGAAYGNPSGGM
jgi:hypothetical protein